MACSRAGTRCCLPWPLQDRSKPYSQPFAQRPRSTGPSESPEDSPDENSRPLCIVSNQRRLARPSTKLVTVVHPFRSAFLAGLFCAFTLAQAPDAWQTAGEFPGLDQAGLSAQQKHVLLSLLRSEGCNCGCTFKIAECRVKDPKCGRSRSLAASVARELQEGKSVDFIR